ncbi:MAG: transporter substrate-binding domain-containing protein [Aeromonadaceae bacterium]|nr:transporter substrate-binding domain-containing protein [Aeromonadaceae bacterium]
MNTWRIMGLLTRCWWLSLLLGGSVSALEPTASEQLWLQQHAGRPLTLGVVNVTGMEQFDYAGKPRGYAQDLARLIEQRLGVKITLVSGHSWSDTYHRFLDGELDLLLGANETPQRRQQMAFTRPLLRHPYGVFANRGSAIKNISDLHQHTIGFLKEDVVASLFPAHYPNLEYHSRSYDRLADAFADLAQFKIDGLITGSDSVTLQQLSAHPELVEIAALAGITSDMTLATHRQDAPLAQLLDRWIGSEQAGALQQILTDNRLLYNRKLLNLSQPEQRWLESQPEIRIGIVEGYLPFDYQQDGKYQGITGAFIRQIQAMTGLKVTLVQGDFQTLYQKMRRGELDLLNMVKTPQRMEQFLFTAPYFKERDVILGRRTSAYLQDVYGLEGKRVAVIKGFWHQQYLQRNLHHVELVLTDSLPQSLQMLDAGRVDYLLENPTVLEFYLHGLNYNDLEKKGTTSTDSFFYFAVRPSLPQLQSIINKCLLQIDGEQMRVMGLNSVPDWQADRIRLLITLSCVLGGALLACLVVGVILTRRFFAQRATNVLLKERQLLLFTDPLTGISNRLHYNQLEEELALCHQPQAWLVIDLNNLKFINDHYGHLAGDRLLIRFAQLLQQLFPQELLFRMGGDEFLLVIRDIDEQQASQLESRLLSELDRHSLLDEEILPLPGAAAAIGLVWRASSAYSLLDTFLLADRRMYEHKRQSKQAVSSSTLPLGCPVA